MSARSGQISVARWSRPAALALASVLSAFLVLNTYWGLGGTWGLKQALGEMPPPPLWAVWIQEVLVVAAIIIVLTRGGLVAVPVPGWVSGAGTWAIAVVFALIGLLNLLAPTVWERAVFGPLALLLTALTVVVAVSPSLGRPTE